MTGPSREAAGRTQLIASIIEQAAALRDVKVEALDAGAVADLDKTLAQMDDDLSSMLSFYEEEGAL
jgi:hypothetical protein